MQNKNTNTGSKLSRGFSYLNILTTAWVATAVVPYTFGRWSETKRRLSQVDDVDLRKRGNTHAG